MGKKISYTFTADTSRLEASLAEAENNVRTTTRQVPRSRRRITTAFERTFERVDAILRSKPPDR